jgi:tetratricopeptide (TPR) repeat protein
MDNPLGQANQLGNLGNVYRERGDLKRAEENYRKSLGIDRRIGHRLGEAIALRNLGLLAGEQGRAEEARGLLREALSLYERMGAGGEGPDKVRVSLRRLEEAGGQEKPRRARKRRSGSSDPDKPAGFEDPRLHVRSHDGSFHQ